MSAPPRSRSRAARPTVRRRRARLAVLVGGVALVVVMVAALGGGSLPRPPAPAPAPGAAGGNLFGYVAARESSYVARATAGNAHVLFTKSPGGVMATAARVAGYRTLIDRATAGTGSTPTCSRGWCSSRAPGSRRSSPAQTPRQRRA